jgi:hypothetical protein
VSLAHDPDAAGGGGFFGPGRRRRRIPRRMLRPDRRAALWAAGEALVRPYAGGLVSSDLVPNSGVSRTGGGPSTSGGAPRRGNVSSE